MDNESAKTDESAQPNNPSVTGVIAYSRSQEQIEKDLDDELRYGAAALKSLIIPVTLCMAAVVIIVHIFEFDHDPTQFNLQQIFAETSDKTASQKFGGAIVNALVIIAVIACITFAMVFLYIKRYYKVLQGFLIVSTGLTNSVIVFLYFHLLCPMLNVPLDYPSLIVFVWNFAAVALLCLHWRGPLLVTQFYMVVASALTALLLVTSLAPYTAWILLALLAVYDLIAVLTPKGPLKMLVDTAQERDESFIPALVYSTTMAWEGSDNSAGNNIADMETADNPQSSDIHIGLTHKTGNHIIQPLNFHSLPVPDNTTNEARLSIPAEETVEEEENGIKLGLGDFVFYSLLVGKAATSKDWATIIACYLAIIVGMCSTLILLALYKKALPALPISILFGVTFYFTSGAVLVPFTEYVAFEQIVF